MDLPGRIQRWGAGGPDPSGKSQVIWVNIKIKKPYLTSLIM